MRKPTKPTIGGQPLSFVKLESTVPQSTIDTITGIVTDAQGRKYQMDESGTVTRIRETKVKRDRVSRLYH